MSSNQPLPLSSCLQGHRFAPAAAEGVDQRGPPVALAPVGATDSHGSSARRPCSQQTAINSPPSSQP